MTRGRAGHEPDEIATHRMCMCKMCISHAEVPTRETGRTGQESRHDTEEMSDSVQ